MDSANRVSVDKDLCKACRLCVETCPRHCLEMDPGLNAMGYAHAVFVNRDCSACGLCFYVCPEPGAITVYGADKEDRP